MFEDLTMSNRNKATIYPGTAAQIVGVSREVIKAAIESGELPSTPFLEPVHKVSEADLEAWLQAHPELPRKPFTKLGPSGRGTKGGMR
jgi:hypothetical protein